MWDEAAGRWKNTAGDDEQEDTPPPPPKLPGAPTMQPNNTPSGPPGIPSAPNPIPLHALAAGATGGSTSTTRSRYVNVLAKQGVSSGTKAVNLAPPLPPTFLPPS